jgi:ABC-type multidrug transport system fused ATPase/permease subunit
MTASRSDVALTGWRALLAHFRPWRRSLLVIGCLSLLAALLDAAVLVAIAPLLVSVGSGKGAVSGTLAGVDITVSSGELVLLSAGLILLRAATTLVARQREARLLGTYDSAMRACLLRQFVRASWTLQAAERAGRLQQFVGGHIGRSQNALRAASQTFAAFAGLVILVLSAVLIGGPVVLAGLLAIGVIAALLRPLQRVTKQAAAEQALIAPTWTAQIAETTAMVRETRLFRLEPVVLQRARSLIDRMRRLYEREVLFTTSAPILFETAGLLLVLFGIAVIRAIEPENLTALGAAAILLMRALMHGKNLQNQHHTFGNLMPFVEALDSQIELYTNAEEPDGDTTLEKVERIELEGVEYRYRSDVIVLEEVSVAIETGRSLGIIGPSGAGKSTLLELLLRLRRPTAGSVRINGADLGTYASDSLYERIRLVPQDPRLFDATVGENVASFRDATDEEIWAALGAAGLDEEVRSMGGLSAPVGALGGELSGGQRQRLCIARAMIGDPDVIIMDEPTGALDAHSEAVVQESLRRLKERVTLIIVAHRLSTLDLCDEILVMSAGRVRAHGERTSLQQTNDYYRDALRLAGLR